jgi:tetratricopeptide (TPR) repeat protein
VSPHLQAMPMLEMFRPYPIVAQVRFGRWEDILKEPKPDEALMITNAYWHFARGSAFVATQQLDNAASELAALQAIAKAIPADAPLGNNMAADVLKIADSILAGKIAFARGDKRQAFDLLNKAAAAEDATHYNEPADWDLPVREVLGSLLLSSGDAATAEKVFREELRHRRGNGRAFFGLAESLKQQGKKSEAQKATKEFQQAWKDADVRLTVEGLGGVKAAAISAGSTAAIERVPR